MHNDSVIIMTTCMHEGRPGQHSRLICTAFIITFVSMVLIILIIVQNGRNVVTMQSSFSFPTFAERILELLQIGPINFNDGVWKFLQCSLALIATDRKVRTHLTHLKLYKHRFIWNYSCETRGIKCDAVTWSWSDRSTCKHSPYVSYQRPAILILNNRSK